MAAVNSSELNFEEESVLELPLGEVREVEPYRHEPRVRVNVVLDSSTSVESATDNYEMLSEKCVNRNIDVMYIDLDTSLIK